MEKKKATQKKPKETTTAKIKRKAAKGTNPNMKHGAESTKKVMAKKVKKAKADFLEIYKNNMCIVATSCRCANISRTQYYQWRKEDAEFAAQCDDIEELQKDMAEASLLKQIKDGNTTMTIFYAKTKMRDRGYGEKQDVNLHTDEELDFSKLTDEELLQYNELLSKMHKSDTPTE